VVRAGNQAQLGLGVAGHHFAPVQHLVALGHDGQHVAGVGQGRRLARWRAVGAAGAGPTDLQIAQLIHKVGLEENRFFGLVPLGVQPNVG
jgi:hypothetical protein